MPMAARNRGTTLPPRFFGPVLLDRGPCSGLTIRMLKLNRPRKPILQEIIRRNVSDQLRIGATWGIPVTSSVNREAPPTRPDHVLTTYRWPLVIIALGLLAVLASLAFLWVARRAYDETL